MPPSRLRYALGLALVGLALSSGHLFTADGDIQYRVAVSLSRGEGWAVADPEAFRRIDYGGRTGPDGRYYAQYAPGLSLVYLPTLPVERLLDLPPAFLASFMNLPVWILVVLLYEGLLLRLGASLKSARAASLLLALASPMIVYARQDFAEPLAALGFLLLAEGLLFEAPLRAGAGLAVASLARAECATAALAFLPILLARGIPPKRRGSLLLAASVGPLLLLAFNLLRFGNPLDFGVPKTGVNVFAFSPRAFTTAAYGLFISPNKGLLFYFPAVLLLAATPWGSARGRARGLACLALATLPYLLVHLSWHSWMGGWSYGPRRLVPLLPVLLLPLPFALDRIRARRHAPGIAAGLVGLSLLAQIPGILFHFGKILDAAAPWSNAAHPLIPKRAEILTWLSPAYSPLVGSFRLLFAGPQAASPLWGDLLLMRLGPAGWVLLAALLAGGAFFSLHCPVIHSPHASDQ